MSSQSKIEWTDATWNPVTGCTPISEGCQRCYAARMAKRLKAMGNPRYWNGFNVTCHESVLMKPASWAKPRKIFVCSMGDLFHPDVPDEFIREVYWVMVGPGSRHTYQVLTKRADRLGRLAGFLPVAGNIWHGVTVEHEDTMHRIERLFITPCSGRRFVSFEPLLWSVDVSGPQLAGMDWVIVGGESGPGARPMKPDWVRAIRDRCIERGIPFFFKQWGGKDKTATLDGCTWKQMPRGQ